MVEIAGHCGLSKGALGKEIQAARGIESCSHGRNFAAFRNGRRSKPLVQMIVRGTQNGTNPWEISCRKPDSGVPKQTNPNTPSKMQARPCDGSREMGHEAEIRGLQQQGQLNSSTHGHKD